MKAKSNNYRGKVDIKNGIAKKKTEKKDSNIIKSIIKIEN